MSKIIIDNNLIDLEMITNIQLDLKNNILNIYLIGPKKPIMIHRSYKQYVTFSQYKMCGISHIQMDKKGASSISLSSLKKMKAQLKVQKMYNELLKRWSPSIVKFDDITIK